MWWYILARYDIVKLTAGVKTILLSVRIISCVNSKTSLFNIYDVHICSLLSGESVLVVQSCLTLCDLTDCNPPGPLPRNSLGKNTGVGTHSFL